MEEIKKRKVTTIDVDYLRGIIENDAELEKELFVIFSENVHRNTIKLEEAMAANDSNSWYMAAHSMKGAASSIGAFDLARILEFAQQHCEDNAVKKAKVLSDIRAELQLVFEFINEEVLEK